MAKILIVDDEAPLLKLCSTALLDEGHRGRGRIGGRAYTSKSTPLPAFQAIFHLASSGVLTGTPDERAP